MASVGDIKTITLPDGNTYDIRDTNAVAMTGATASSAGASGLVPAPTSSDNTKFLRGDGTWEDGGKPMVILSYGSSTWNDFINAYNSNVIVYCRASSNSNPATGSQTRMAFMAYVNNATAPTEVEFQYYRSVSTHSASQQGDQVFVYKLTSSGTWTVTAREAMAKIVAGTNLSSTYSNNVLTINGNYQAMTGASSSAAGETGLVPAPSAGDEGKYLRGDGTWNSVDISDKADKADTVLTTTLSRGRKSGMSVGTRSFAFGDNVTASGTDSYAQGSNTTASEELAHAEGRYTTANGYYSHAEGNYTTASGMASHAEGTVTTATHANQHVFGEYNVEDGSSASAVSRGNYVEIVGNGTGSAAKSNARALDWDGNEYLKGDLYVGCGADSAGGTKVVSTTFEGATSSAAGSKGYVPAPSAGDQNKFLRGDGTWAEGGSSESVYGNTIDMSSTDSTKVSEAIAAKASIIITDTDKAFNHDELSNVNKITFHGNEYAFKTCRYANEKNLAQTYDRTYTTIGVEVQCVNHFIIMNGTGTSTSNTNAIDTAGDTIPAGNYVAYININANGTVISIAKTFEIVAYYTDDTTETFSESAGVDDITISMTFAKDVKKLRIRPGIRQDVVYTDYTFWVGVYSEDVVITDTNLTVQDEATVDYVAQISDTVIDTMQHESVVSEIQDTKEYVDKKADKVDTVLETTLSRGRKANTTIGTGSFAFGSEVNASGNYSHAEGYNTSATGSYSHAEGGGTVAKVYSHAEGYTTKALGECSHSEGFYTTAQRKSQHAGGEYNVPDTAGTEHTRGDYAEIIGNGTSSSSLSNARVLDWNGNERLAGDLYVNCNADSTGGTKVITTPMTGATSSVAGATGLVPAPSAGDQDKVLSGAGTWITPPDASGKADKVSGATSGNFAGLDSNGNLIDSGHKSDDYLEQTYEYYDTFIEQEWIGIIKPDGRYIWSDGVNIYYSSSTTQYVLNKQTSTWQKKTWYGISGFSGEKIWSDGDTIYYSNGSSQYVLDKPTSTWSVMTWTGLSDIAGENVWTDGENVYYSYNSSQFILDKQTSTWSSKTWTGLTSFAGSYIWTDGTNIYFSNGSTQKILDTTTSSWSDKTWTGLTNFSATSIWIDNENIYYSSGSNQYILDKSTSTWNEKTWNTLVNFYGLYVWTDGINIYYGTSSMSTILDRDTSTWNDKVWNGPIKFSASNIWTDGKDKFCSNGSTQLVFNKTTSLWETKTWTTLTSFYGVYIWSDGENIYYSNGTNQYYLNSSSTEWITATWHGLSFFNGTDIWTDGENIYYSYGSNHYELTSSFTWSPKTWTGINNFDGLDVWSDGNNIYYSTGSNQKILDKSTSSWSNKTWTGKNPNGSNVWSDGENIYYSYLTSQYVLDVSSSTWFEKTWIGATNFYGSNIWSDGENIYLSDSVNQCVLLKDNGVIFIGKRGKWNKILIDNFITQTCMSGASTSSSGTSGFVPAPSAGDQNKVLTGAGTWWTAGAPLLTPSTAFSIPSVGTPAVYDMPGITANHELIQWNFSASAENNPPASLSWETYDGYFMITNNAGTTSETIKPVFAPMVSVALTTHVEEGE